MSKVAKLGFLGSLFVMALGCTDASQGVKVVTNTVTVTVTATGDGGGKPGDGHHGDNAGGHEAAGGEGGASATTSSTEGAGGSPATTTTSTDTGKGGAGGTPVTTTTTKTGTGGAGGAATTTTSSTSTTSTTTTTSSTTTSTTTTSSTSTATGPKKVTLHIHDVPPTSGDHAINLFAYALPSDPAIQWGNVPNVAVFGAGTTVNFEVAENTQVFYGVVADPPAGSNPSQGAYWTNQGCDPLTLSLAHSAWATVSIPGVPWDEPAPPVKVVSNGKGGCWMVATAAKSPLISATDEDGDGYSPNDPNPKLRDCDDKSNAVHPGAVETPGTYDKVDANCDGWLDPPKAVISMTVAVPAASIMPTFHDVANGKDYPLMALGPKSQVYQIKVEATKQSLANLEAYVSWPQTNAQYPFCVGGTCYDSSFFGGTCHDGVTLEIFWDTDLTETPLELVPVGNPAFTCHRRIKK